MGRSRYFPLGPVAGSPHTRYAVLEGGTVVEVLASRPDGKEVPRLLPFVGGTISATWFNNCPPAGRGKEAA